MDPSKTFNDLGVSEGDIINIRARYHTRETCDHIASWENIYHTSKLHYVEPQVREVVDYVLPNRVKVKFVDAFGVEMVVTVKDDAKMGDMMEAFAKLAGRDVGCVRFRFGHEVVAAEKTLGEVSICEAMRATPKMSADGCRRISKTVVLFTFLMSLLGRFRQEGVLDT